ncbi:MAG: GNAT family N-acetyltransferase [Sandaracinaceae bacterium]
MAGDWPSPPYRVETPRTVIRVYEPGDVDALHAAIGANVEALRPTMPWIADEPLSRGARAEVLRSFRGWADLGTNFIFGVFGRDGGFLGGTGLHPRQGPGTLEIGYWIIQARWGEGLATEIAAAMTQSGLRWMGASRVEIRTDTTNLASARVAEKLGYRHEGTLRGVGTPIGDRPAPDLHVFGMLEAELDGSPADEVRIREVGFAGAASTAD